MTRRPKRRVLASSASLAPAARVGASAATVVATPPNPPPPSVGRHYGPGIAMDSLTNTRVGGPYGTKVAYRFRAEQSSVLTGYRGYWLNQSYSGYGGGTGGIIRVTLQTDAAGVPSGVALTSLTITSPPSLFAPYEFPTPVTLVAGIRYHLVWENVDPAPTVNYGSVDSIGTKMVESPRQPGRSDDDYAVFYRTPDSSSWTLRTNHTPIIDLTYGNGAHQGIGYMEVEVANQVNIAGSTHMARERFTVSGSDRVVSGAAVRLAKTGGTGNVVVTLEDSVGTALDSFSVSSAALPIGTRAGGVTPIWVSGMFSAPRTLRVASSYRLRVSTDAATSLWTIGIQQGGGYGMHPSTFFADGVLEVTTNGSTWAVVSGLNQHGDLQFYLRTV